MKSLLDQILVYLRRLPFFSILLFTACSVTSPIAVNTTEPAPVDLSKDIRRIGIYSEEFKSEEAVKSFGLDEWVQYTDQLLSEAGREAALKGLFEKLTEDPRFDTIVIIESDLDKKLFSQQSAHAIQWNAMKDICLDNRVDALFSLAYFQTDTKVTLKKAKVNQKDLLRENIMVSGSEITLETLIENGWRIYDPFNKAVLDEIVLNEQLVNTAKGENSFDAFQAVEDRKDSLISISGKNGSTFALRLQPYERLIERDFFVKGSENMVKADEFIKNENWAEAKILWESDSTNPDPKISGRACHNLAVLSEYNGDLETALAWALKSTAVYNSKLAANYLDALETRLVKTQLIEEQLMK